MAGKITIERITDLPDGSAELEFTYDEDFKKIYRKATGKTRVTRKGMGKFIEELMKNSADNIVKNIASNKK